jgi:hypothetical protein
VYVDAVAFDCHFTEEANILEFNHWYCCEALLRVITFTQIGTMENRLKLRNGAPHFFVILPLGPLPFPSPSSASVSPIPVRIARFEVW